MNNNIFTINLLGMKKIILVITTGLLAVSLWNSFSSFGVNKNHSLPTSTNITEEPKSDKICTNENKLINSEAKPENQTIQKLQQYEQICNSKAVDELMLFIDTPVDTAKAKSKAEAFSQTLKEFDNYNIKPLVVFEPVTDDGFISYREIIDGKWDDVFNTFFGELKSLGLTDSQIGTWVILPESNTPIWNHDGTSQEEFGYVFNKIAGSQKQAFPESKSTILLNSQSYEPGDTDWEFGEYSSFKPFLENIDRGLLDSFGVQALPWISPKDRKNGLELLDASEFVRINLTIEATEFLDIDKIWINTGSFSEKYTISLEKAQAIPHIRREYTLDTILTEAKTAKEAGLDVSINLFSEDKSGAGEDTNWTYLDSENNHELFTNFAKNVNEENISLTLFDK